MRISSFRRTTVPLLAAYLLAGCEPVDSLGPDLEPTNEGLSFSSASDTLRSLGATAQLEDQLLNSTSDASLTWHSRNPEVALVDDVGQVTAVGPGRTHIVAKALGRSDSVEVVVHQAPAEVLADKVGPINAIGDTLRLHGRVIDRNGFEVKRARPAWKNLRPEIASLTDGGELVSHRTGTARLVLSHGALHDTVDIQVRQVIADLEVRLQTTTLSTGQRLLAVGIASDSNAVQVPNTAIEWSSTNPKVAEVNDAGLIHAVAPGAPTLRASSGGAVAKVQLRIEQAKAGVPAPQQSEVVSVAVSPSSKIMSSLGSKAKLEALAVDASGTPLTDEPIAWYSTDPSVVEVDDEGYVTSRAEGEVSIFVVAGGHTGKAKVVVAPQESEVTTLSISPTSVQLSGVGQTLALSAVARDRSGRASSDCSVAWSSASPNVVEVNAEGRVLAKMVGSALITAVCAGVADTVMAQVQPSGALVVSPSTVSVAEGGQTKLSAAAEGFDGAKLNDPVVEWESSNRDVVTVDGEGRITGVSAGTATITARSVYGSAKAEVKVTEANSLTELSPASPPVSASGELVVYPNDRIAFIAGPQLRANSSANPWPWFDETAAKRGLALFDQFGASVDYYYDFALTQYIQYYRTGDVRYLEAARVAADAQIDSHMPLGTKTAPRSIAAGGMMLRAIELEEENPARADSVWTWLEKWARHHDYSWISRHYDRGTLWYGVRDGAFTMLTMAQLAAVHPDAAVRADMLERTRRASLDYYLRLQAADGGWYWTAGDTFDGNAFSQPFQIGMLGEALIAYHQLSGDSRTAAGIVKMAEWLWEKGYVKPGELPNCDFRSMRYFVGLDVPSNPGDYCGKTYSIHEERQLNPTTLHVFGYAYQLTGDPKFREWGDEVAGSTYGFYSGLNGDGKTALCFDKAKSYNQCYRTAGRYLAWRLDL